MEASYGRVMAISLLDLLGFGSDRAIANAGREMLRLRTEEQLIGDLVDALARQDTASCRPGLRSHQGGDLATGMIREEPPGTRCGCTTMHGPIDSLRLWRLDYTTSDEPVSLTSAVQALRGLGVTVGICDVRPGAAGHAVVGGSVVLPPWLDVPAVEYALRCTGATDVRAVPLLCATGAPLTGGHRT